MTITLQQIVDAVCDMHGIEPTQLSYRTNVRIREACIMAMHDLTGAYRVAISNVLSMNPGNVSPSIDRWLSGHTPDQRRQWAAAVRIQVEARSGAA